MRRHLFQDFSLPGQPRDRSLPLRDLLADEGSGAARVLAWSAGRRTAGLGVRLAGLPGR